MSDLLDSTIEAIPPISLAEMNDAAALMTRAEQKYFLPRRLLHEILTETPSARVLQIDGVRTHEYASLYFDTPSLLFYRQHVQGRRIRYKVRIRSYSSGESFLEVKGKGNRGQTVKERILVESTSIRGAREQAFINEHLPDAGIAGVLAPVLTTSYNRVTFISGANRITCDFHLRFRGEGRDGGNGPIHHGPDDVLVETKTPSVRSEIDRRIVRAGIRPVSMSKYGVGISLAVPHVPSNRWSRVLRQRFDHSPARTRLNVHSLLRRNEAGVTAAMVRS